MRELGADFVRVGDIWVKFPKQEPKPIQEQAEVPPFADGYRIATPEGFKYVRREEAAEIVKRFYESQQAPAEQGLDESDHAELAKGAGRSEPQPDTMEWFKQEAVPRGDD